LESITNGKARITIQTINEPKAMMPAPSNYTGGLNFSTSDQGEGTEMGEARDNSKWWLYSGIILLVIAFTAFIVHMIDMRQRRKYSRFR
jgi:hypothetical protein